MGRAELTLASRVVASKDQVSARLSGESVVLGLREGVYYGLDAVASRIWELVREPCTVKDLAAVVHAEFDVTTERAEADVVAFVGQLASRGLVDVVAD